MATLDHIILKVNDLKASIEFYTDVLGFAAEGTDGPFAVLRAGPDFVIQTDI
jgi:catechol 2,3-dioxygenase-like lactoylglutathione lyase family enzyme